MIDCSSSDLILNTDWNKVVKDIEQEREDLWLKSQEINLKGKDLVIKEPKESSVFSGSNGFIMIKVSSAYYAYHSKDPFRITGEAKFFQEKDKKNKKFKLRFYKFEVPVSSLWDEQNNCLREIAWTDIDWKDFVLVGYGKEYLPHVVKAEEQIIDFAKDTSTTSSIGLPCWDYSMTRRHYHNTPDYAVSQLLEEHENSILASVNLFANEHEDQFVEFVKQYFPFKENFKREGQLSQAFNSIKQLRDSLA